MNATNDGIIWANAGSVGVEAYMSALSNFGNYLFYSYDGTSFNWFTAA